MHIKFSHPIKKCVGCSEFFVPQKFANHAKNCFFEPKNSCICPFCEIKIPMNNLSEHVLTHPIAECPLCNKDIPQKEAELHMESCYLEKVNDCEESVLGTLFNCPICRQRYSFEKMPEHIIKNHLSLNCVFCYMVMSLEEMRGHVVVCSQKKSNE
ncbi:hypothetical protein LOD99_13222 [Oopsacas minuta]|uniref:Uncharacterized protein n=1 Tax=Oopsacas minuta TaxID=111878 RepID=A0AAV7JB74_9METZ|nr:hypothetical protein LOD99_13222 [Oopsacas minuta]